MHMIIEIIRNTPIWFYILFVLLIRRGIKGMQARTITPAKLLIIPIALILVVEHRLGEMEYSTPALIGIAIGTIAAAVLVAVLKPARTTERLEDGKLRIQGEYYSLVIILIIFSANYTHGVLTSVSPDIAGSYNAQLIFSAFNCFSFSFLIIRAALHLRVACSKAGITKAAEDQGC